MGFPASSEANLPAIFTTGKPVTREMLMAFGESMLDNNELDDYGFCLRHMHAPGVYARELFIPAGMVIVGKIHKHAHHNNISLGKIAVATEFGSYVLTAPYGFVSEPGTKRAVYALEDTMWTTYHAVESGCLEDIEGAVIAASYEEYDRYAQALLAHSKGDMQ